MALNKRLSYSSSLDGKFNAPLSNLSMTSMHISSRINRNSISQNIPLMLMHAASLQ